LPCGIPVSIVTNAQPRFLSFSIDLKQNTQAAEIAHCCIYLLPLQTAKKQLKQDAIKFN